MATTTPASRYYFGIMILMVGIAVFVIFNFIPSRYLSDPAETPTKLFFADNISPAHQEIITRFNRQHAGEIQVVPIHLPFDRFTTNERKELLARSLRSQNSRIDIFAVDIIWVPRFSRWAMPLNHTMGDQLKNLLDEAMFTAYYDDRLVSIPFYIDVGLMYYRRDIVRSWPDGLSVEKRIRRGITWEELTRLRDTHAPQKPFYVFQGDQYEGVVCQFVELIGDDTTFLANAGQPDWNAPVMVQSLEALVNMIHRDGLIPDEVSSFRERHSYSYALSHDIPFFRGWPGLDQRIEGYGDDSSKVKQLGIAPIPHFAGRRPAGTFGGWNLMVSRHSSKREAALEFLRYAISRESQELLIEKGHYYPVNREFYSGGHYLEQYPDLQYFRTLLRHGVHRPWLKNYTEISEVLSYYLNKALKQEIPPAAALQGVEQTLNSTGVFIR